MKKPAIIFLALVLSATSMLSSSAAGKMTRLGSDPAGDGPAGSDVTFLDVGRNKDSLEIRIGVEMLPPFGGVPEGPGIEWIFTAGKRSFIAEAVASRNPKFFFFELFDDHSYEQLQGMTGTYDWNEGFIRMLVPLELIGAKKGTLVTGYHDPLPMITKDNGTDVDSHVHNPAGGTKYLDDMKTTKSYRIP